MVEFQALSDYYFAMRYLPLTSLLLFSAAFSANGQLWDKNLIVNGGVENGPGVTLISAAAVKNIPGWTTNGNFTICQYGNGIPADPRWVQNYGKQYFAGGPGGGGATARQVIDLSAGAKEIDAGQVRFFLTAIMSNGGSAIAAPTKLTATFLDAAGKTLLEYSVTGPTVAEIDVNQFLPRGGSGFVLPNTRSVQLVLDLTGKAVTFNSAEADNLNLTLSLQPVLGAELVVNGDGETQTDSTFYPHGWNSADDFLAMKWASSAMGAKDPGPDDRGIFLFAQKGSAGIPPPTTAYQSIDVTLAKDRIDGGGVGFKLSAWMGGTKDGAADSCDVKATFLDGGGKTLGTVVHLGPVTLADRGGVSALLLRTSEGNVPVGTRVVQVSMSIGTTKAPTFGVKAYVDGISFSISSGGALAIKDNGIVNAATGDPGPVAPGEMIMVYATGINLASAARTQLDSTGRVTTTLANVRLFFDGTQAPMLSVNSGQVGAVVPFDVDPKSNVQVRLEYQGVPTQTVSMEIAKTSPGIFTQDGSASGVGLIYNADYSLNSKDTPAPEGSAVTMYWTGGGQTAPGGIDGRMETMGLSRPNAAVSVTIGGQAADLIYAGSVPYLWAGLLIAEAKVPVGLSTGDPVAVPVVITAGTASSPDKRVTVWVKQ